MTKRHRTTEKHTVGRDAFCDYEDVHREALRKYNALLLDARGRLQIALQRVEQEQGQAEPESIRDLRAKIRGLIEYLSEASL